MNDRNFFSSLVNMKPRIPVELLSRHGEKTKLLAAGQGLIVLMKLCLANLMSSRSKR